MNYLAHLLLAGPDEGMRLGALIGDFMAGMGVEEFAADVQAGIWLHRKIDRWTDAHPVFRRSKRRCPDRLRRFAGVIVDVAYDHCLALEWERWCPGQGLGEFAGEVYGLLDKRAEELPPRLERAREWIVGEDWLSRYGDPGHVRRVFAGMGRRVRRENRLVEAGEFVVAEVEGLREDFGVFFGELCGEVGS